MTAPFLPKRFVDENFDFDGKELRGGRSHPAVEALRGLVNSEIGEALARSSSRRTSAPS